MLDTGRKTPTIDFPDRFDFQAGARPRPSFGLGSLRSRKGLLGVGTILCLAVGLFYVARRTPTYTAAGEVLIYIRQILPGVDLATLPGQADLSLVRNQIEMLRSGNVLTKVVETLRLNEDAEFASSSTMDAVRRRLRVQQIGTSHLISVSFKASEPERAARVVNSVINFYLQELVRASEAASSKAPALRELYQNLGPSARVISEADPPLRADGPPAVLILFAAALSGLGIAAAIAILLDVMNDTIRSARQTECALGLRCLGVIPRRTAIDTLGEGIAAQGCLSQGYAMRQAAAAMLDESLRVIGVTSTLPGEGATTVATALAQTLATMGRSVLLVDRIPENPAAGAIRLDRLAENSGGTKHPYEFVIVDMPALAAGPDVRAAARSLDGFLIVVKWGETESELVRQGFRSAGEAREKFFGAVLNMADEKMMQLYGDASRADSGIAISS